MQLLELVLRQEVDTEDLKYEPLKSKAMKELKVLIAPWGDPIGWQKVRIYIWRLFSGKELLCNVGGFRHNVLFKRFITFNFGTC